MLDRQDIVELSRQIKDKERLQKKQSISVKSTISLRNTSQQHRLNSDKGRKTKPFVLAHRNRSRRGSSEGAPSRQRMESDDDQEDPSDLERIQLINRHLETIESLPKESRYAIHRRKVLTKAKELLEAGSTGRTSDEELELQRLLSLLSL